MQIIGPPGDGSLMVSDQPYPSYDPSLTRAFLTVSWLRSRAGMDRLRRGLLTAYYVSLQTPDMMP